MAFDYLSNLPNEILLRIFKYLPAKDVMKCRRVCSRFGPVADLLIGDDRDYLWQKYIRNDFPNIYKVHGYKSSMALYDIYKSLTLWSKLADAYEELDEFAPASNVEDEILYFIMHRDGVIGVRNITTILYYNIRTLERSYNATIVYGEYLNYSENENAIVVLGTQMDLCIFKKKHNNKRKFVDTVRTFILTDEIVYFVTISNDVFLCTIEDLSIEFIKHLDDVIVSLGHDLNKLYILTLWRNIYEVHGKAVVIKCALSPASNLLHELFKYNLLDKLDWTVYNQWMYEFNHRIPEGPLRDITTVHAYGDVVFVGSMWGVLRIYYSPYLNGEFDLYNAEPVKQYNFMERQDCPVLSMCPIVQIDVMEAEEGHIVIAAMPKKIAVVKLTHKFSRTPSAGMIPCQDLRIVQTVHN